MIHEVRRMNPTRFARNDQHPATHESAPTTRLYDRRNDQVSLDEVGRSLIHIMSSPQGKQRTMEELESMEASTTMNRGELTRRGQRLEYFTIAWNILEGLAALISGLLAGSIALIGFGLDSLIEVISGAALLWRLHYDADERQRAAAERIALRIVGSCFIGLSIYITFHSLHSLIFRKAPEHSIAGIVVAIAALVVMPLLARAKRNVARQLRSAALQADAKQTDFCAYLAAILLLGLILNALFGLWWADPAAGLIMVPIIVREGWYALQGKTCADGCGH
jgi:divalent metal cation (Fe/Co/Zn/Cd) transporter